MTDTLFDLNDHAVITDPYPHYAWLREHAPVYHDADLGLWVLSRYDDVHTAVRDASRFSSDLGAWTDLTSNPFNPSLKIPRWLVRLIAKVPAPRVLLTIDPPDHTVLRRKVSRAFTPRAIAAWEPRIRQITEKLVDDMLARGGPRRGDLVHELAGPLPTTVIAELMGIPAERQADFKRWSDNLVNGQLTQGSTTRMITSAVEISWFFARTVRRRRKNPGDDLISMLVRTDNDDALTMGELIAFCILLLVAGNETTTNLISNTMLALFDRPDLYQRLRADPTLAAAAVEEGLRYDGPGLGLLRVTTTDVTFADRTIPKGEQVLALIAAANRDPRHWNQPEDFSLDRGRTEHLAFGTGIHFCIGNALARIEARIAIETLFRRLPDLHQAGVPVRIQSPVLRGLRTLPITLTPPAA